MQELPVRSHIHTVNSMVGISPPHIIFGLNMVNVKKGSTKFYLDTIVGFSTNSFTTNDIFAVNCTSNSHVFELTHISRVFAGSKHEKE